MATGGFETRLHATAVCLGPRAALLRGPSGAGKSDLALRCLALSPQGPWGGSFDLVADDQVLVRKAGPHLELAPPERLAGLLEVRGLGIVRLTHRAPVALALLVDLVKPAEIDRFPDPWPAEDLLGLRIPIFRVDAADLSAPAKVALALAQQVWQAPSP